MTSSLLKLLHWREYSLYTCSVPRGNAAVPYSLSACFPNSPPLPSPPSTFTHPFSDHEATTANHPSRPIPPLSLSVICPLPVNLSGLTSPNHCRHPPLRNHLLNAFMRAGISTSCSATALGTVANAKNSERERGKNQVIWALGGKLLS